MSSGLQLARNTASVVRILIVPYAITSQTSDFFRFILLSVNKNSINKN
jgi:hypothetical protein